MKALPLAQVDRAAQLSASAIAQHLTRASVLSTAAVAWARALEVPVEISAADVRQTPAHGVCQASAGLLMADGRAAALTVPTHLLAGMMGALAGAAPRPVGPVPLSPAEEGLFGFLALEWIALWPTPPALDWIDGGVGLIEAPWRAACVQWQVRVGEHAGIARWRLPADSPAPRPDTPRGDLPARGLLSAGGGRLRGPIRAGDLVVLSQPAALRVGRRRWPVRHQSGVWHVTTMKEVRMPEPLDDLPVTVDAMVGQVTLTVAEISALAPGAVVPLAPDLTPIVTLMAGGQPVAHGVLVDDDGCSAVQITQIIQAPLPG